ncbi:MAG: VOC family protein [Paracoccaceae bacterium]
MELDHLAVAGETLEAAIAYVEEALGVQMQPGGAHPVFGTHNALLGLADGLYLEAIATDPAVVPERTPRWFDLDRLTGPPHLRNWICRCADLRAELARAPVGAGSPVALSRGELRWQMAVPDDGILPLDNIFPALISWQSRHPAPLLTQKGCRLKRLEVSHPLVEKLDGDLPLCDPRVVFVTGEAALNAEFETPHGIRSLC